MVLTVAFTLSGILSSLTYCFYSTLFLDSGERSIPISRDMLWKPEKRACEDLATHFFP